MVDWFLFYLLKGYIQILMGVVIYTLNENYVTSDLYYGTFFYVLKILEMLKYSCEMLIIIYLLK